MEPVEPVENAVEPNFCEIARSFSFKLNLGNYQSADFFCSQKISCPIEQAEEVSKRLYDFCRSEVSRAVREFKEQKGMI